MFFYFRDHSFFTNLCITIPVLTYLKNHQAYYNDYQTHGRKTAINSNLNTTLKNLETWILSRHQIFNSVKSKLQQNYISCMFPIVPNGNLMATWITPLRVICTKNENIFEFNKISF